MNTEELYIRGFNEGYIIAEHEPELSDKLAMIESSSPRVEGLRDGGNQFLLDKIKLHRSKWMSQDIPKGSPPDKSKDQDKER